MSYERYFNIDNNFHPVVDQAVIAANPDLWKGYYPHATFVKLVRGMLTVLEGSKNRGLWVKGAYGSGKSHAVLTLEKLVQAGAAEAQEYFSKYPDVFGDKDNRDMVARFLATKPYKVLTVHRSGSAQMNSQAMLYAVQESIADALRCAGYSTEGMVTARDEILNYLKDDNTRAMLEFAMSRHPDLLPGMKVEDLQHGLETYTGDALNGLVREVGQLGERIGMRIGKLDHETLKAWITEAAEKNGLYKILFFWDEFSEFFLNNRDNLTGFQELSQLSNGGKFHFIIVTHDSNALFDDRSENGRKLSDRFEMHLIDLPENTAFSLLGTAMKVTEDGELRKRWTETVHPALSKRTREARKMVKEKAKIEEKDLNAILPLHPYAALVLKHVAVAYASNQRSMFGFICSKDLEEHGFRWFIKEYDPFNSENPLLTMDMLWDFFCGRGLQNLSPEFRNMLMTYDERSKGCTTEELPILKVVLLLETLSRSVGNVDYLDSTLTNIRLAVEGSELAENYLNILTRMEEQGVLQKNELRGRIVKYSAARSAQDPNELNKKKEELKAKRVHDLFAGIDIDQKYVNKLPADVKARYGVYVAFHDDWESKLRECRQRSRDGKLGLLFCLALNTDQQATLRAKIREESAKSGYNVVFVDATATQMDTDLWRAYLDSEAHSLVFSGRDNNQSEHYHKAAVQLLEKWLAEVFGGRFAVYSHKRPEGTEVQGRELADHIRARIGDFYPDALEVWGHRVSDTLWTGAAMQQGARCGAERQCSGQYKAANADMQPQNFMEGAWQDTGYMEKNPDARISKLSKSVNDFIRKKFKASGEVAMRELVEYLRKGSYGLLPCNMSAFVLGFVMRDYAAESYQWSDGTTSAPMSVEKLSEMLKEVMQGANRRELFLRAMSEEMRSFVKATANIFGLDEGRCGSTELARNQLQTKMRSYGFPIWPLADLAANDAAAELVRLYVGLVNPANYGDGTKSDADLAAEIGRLSLGNPGAADAVKCLLPRCQEGMQAYLGRYRDGILHNLAKEIGDNGAYLNRLAEKFDARDALWLWNKETVNQKIDELVVEYEIAAETNKFLTSDVHSYVDAMVQWTGKCEAIAISYAAAENFWGPLKEFMEYLLLYKQGKQAAKTSQAKSRFLELLRGSGRAFRDFYADQPSMFARVCAAELNNVAPGDIEALYRALPTDGIFEKSKAAYSQLVAEKAAAFVQGKGINRLRALWKEKTGTETPQAWSRQNRTPILCLVPEDELREAQAAFALLEADRASVQDVAKAEQYLTWASFPARLTDKAVVDAALLDSLAGAGLRDLLQGKAGELREALLREVGADCYAWYPANRNAEQVVRRFAAGIYRRDGYRRAEDLLQQMDAGEMRRYLLEAVKDDMDLGLAILNHGKELS